MDVLFEDKPDIFGNEAARASHNGVVRCLAANRVLEFELHLAWWALKFTSRIDVNILEREGDAIHPLAPRYPKAVCGLATTARLTWPVIGTLKQGDELRGREIASGDSPWFCPHGISYKLFCVGYPRPLLDVWAQISHTSALESSHAQEAR